MSYPNKSTREMLEASDIKEFIEYNVAYDNDRYRLSESSKFNIVNIEKWISIRDGLRYTENAGNGEWKCIDIKIDHTKYGSNYIFVDTENKLWRIKPTASEFYNSVPKVMYEF